MLAVALVFASGFAGLAGLVAAGTAGAVDAYGLRHWMPGLTPAAAADEPSLVGALVPFYGLRSPDALDFASAAVSLPGYILVSTVLLGAALLVLWQRRAALVVGTWATAFVVGNLGEVVSKSLLTRPALSASTPSGPAHLVVYDSSYPSGHALRTCLLAVLAVALWRRLWPLVACWGAAALVLLVADGAHTITDVAGGVLLAGFVVSAAAWVGGWPAAENPQTGSARPRMRF